MNGSGTTHVFIVTEGQKKENLAAYITLKASSLIKVYEQDGKEYNEGHAALEIAELAVDLRYEHIGIGTALLDFAVKTAADLNNSLLGIEYITLCSDPKAVDFYLKYRPFPFDHIENYWDLPRDGWNVSCKPMFLKMP